MKPGGHCSPSSGSRWRLKAGRPISVAIALVLAATGLVACTAPPDPTAPDSTAAAPAPEARAVVESLEQLPADPSAGLSADSPVAGSDLGAVFPPGTTVTADPVTWTPDHQGGGIIEVTINRPGEEPETYAGLMIEEDGEWKLIATVDVDDV